MSLTGLSNTGIGGGSKPTIRSVDPVRPAARSSETSGNESREAEGRRIDPAAAEIALQQNLRTANPPEGRTGRIIDVLA